MISDVPIGAFLSGGIDSSLLVALMARHSERPVRTFSVAFAEGNLDESPIAALVARQFGTDHTVLHAEALGPDTLLELLGRLDEPFCDPAFIPTHALSELTRCHVKVALSGDGGDERSSLEWKDDRTRGSKIPTLHSGACARIAKCLGLSTRLRLSASPPSRPLVCSGRRTMGCGEVRRG